MTVLAYLLALLAAAVTIPFFHRVRSPAGIVLWIPKVLAQSAAPLVALLGLLGAVLGVFSRAPLAVAAGLLGTLIPVSYVVRVTASHDGFERAFGKDWQRRIKSQRAGRMLRRRWVGLLPAHPEVRCQKDVVFCTLAASDTEEMSNGGRELLCDIWQPPEGTNPSGLAFVYLHGGSWHWMDKDFNTRPLFRHLAAQGHLVMDVAFRQCPEVDVRGMVGDVKRAVAWMKRHAESYGADPRRVVLAGGSSGGHLALLAAYTPDHPELTPEDVASASTAVRGVVAYYGAADLSAVYRNFAMVFGSLMKGLQPGEGNILFKITGALTGRVAGDTLERKRDQPPFSINWMMTNMTGGTLKEMPEAYELLSPITHVSPAAPPTLLLQGQHDFALPAQVTRALHDRLLEAGVPCILVEFPQTEHAFDVGLPRLAPAAHAALHDVERFLALLAETGEDPA
jgi:acetyl esterase/lipase